MVVLCGIIGAKILYIVNDWGYYSSHPGDIFSFSTLQAGGVFSGGLIGAAVAAVWYIRKHRMPALATWDAFAPGLAMGHAIGRVGCFAAGCCYGKPTSHFWGVTFTNPVANPNSYTPLGVPLEPTQLFEAAVELANFFILMWLFKRKKFDGQVLAAFLDPLRRGPLFSGIHSRRSRARFGIRRNHDRHPVDLHLPGDYWRLHLVAEVVSPSGSGARAAVGSVSSLNAISRPLRGRARA